MMFSKKDVQRPGGVHIFIFSYIPHLDEVSRRRAEVVQQGLRDGGARMLLVLLDEASQQFHVLGGLHLLQRDHSHVASRRELVLRGSGQFSRSHTHRQRKRGTRCFHFHWIEKDGFTTHDAVTGTEWLGLVLLSAFPSLWL